MYIFGHINNHILLFKMRTDTLLCFYAINIHEQNITKLIVDMTIGSFNYHPNHILLLRMVAFFTLSRMELYGIFTLKVPPLIVVPDNNVLDSNGTDVIETAI